MEPTNMQPKHTDTDAVVPSRVHGKHSPVNDEYMPKSIWQPGVVRRLADYIKQLREVDDQSNQRVVANQPHQSDVSRHVCPRNPHRTCNCSAGVCADDSATYRHARGPFLPNRVPTPKPNNLGNFRCPITGQLCSFDVCREWCEGSSPSATINSNRGNAKTTDNR